MHSLRWYSFAYLNDEFMGLNVGKLFLVLVFFLCLVGALVPLRYFQAEYRPIEGKVEKCSGRVAK